MSKPKNEVEMLYKAFENGSIQCLACNKYCVMKEGKTGVCGVRRNHQGKLDMIVYGKIIGPGPSPMEKKPMFHFMPATNTYSIVTVGCNFITYSLMFSSE